METRKLTLSALLISIGTLAGHFFIPFQIAKCYPIQHTINVLSAIFLGPYYALLNAFTISLLRNILGTGTLFAFPGSMIGALLAGILYMRFKKELLAVLGEVFGTGILGGLLAFPISKFILGNDVGAFIYIIPFLVSTVVGSLLAYLILISIQPMLRKRSIHY